jgi:hypothetical protein
MRRGGVWEAEGFMEDKIYCAEEQTTHRLRKGGRLDFAQHPGCLRALQS